MVVFCLDQRVLLYRQEAARAGIHPSILAALDRVQHQPLLPGGDTGLGIAPANRLPLEQVSSFTAQVRYAAQTVRSLTDRLIAQGWHGSSLWDGNRGCYAEPLVQAIAAGYAPAATDINAALLEASDPGDLWHTYLEAWHTDAQSAQLPDDLSAVDERLLMLVEQVPRAYLGLPHQRTALLELVRIWRRLADSDAAIATFSLTPAAAAAMLTPPLLQFAQQAVQQYAGYPHQREALLRLVQLWQQLDCRERAIAALTQDTSLELPPDRLDAALIALVLRIPRTYQAEGEQRNALVEGFRLWHHLETRSAALIALGVNPDLFATVAPSPTALKEAAIQSDRALLDFLRQVPLLYQATAPQRAALLRLTQLWHRLDTPEQTQQLLVQDLHQMYHARRDAVEAAPVPTPLLPPISPPQWTPATLQLHASILPNGSFTWAEATQGGIYLPPDQETLERMICIAHLAQPIRDRLRRPLHIVYWYCPENLPPKIGGVFQNRHIIGDAIAFYCDGLSGDQLYWFLDPWWMGGLGRYQQFPCLCYLDADRDRPRWNPSSSLHPV